MITLASAFTKSTAGAWAAGTAQNGMGTGLTIANSTWYHVFLILNSGSADVYFDTSVTAANAPASTTASRRIGSFLTDGAAHIISFVQNGDRFDWLSPVGNISGAPGVTTAILSAMSTPLGVTCEAILSGNASDSTTGSSILYLSNPAQTDVAAGASALTCQAAGTSGPGSYAGVRIMTDTSSQIRRRVSSTTLSILINTNGYIDRRGQG